MKNFLNNGTVLPSGLLNDSINARMEGFNKSYRDTPLRAGVIVNIYPVTDSQNRTKLATEYDVVTTQQNEDRGATTIRYRNCLSSDGVGGIADFFQMNLRPKTTQDYSGDTVRFAGQDGTIVLLLCLDAASNKAIIIGGFPHPDQEIRFEDDQPQLQGEYNGVNIAVDTDGSTTLTFNGATDSEGNPLDEELGQTTIQIEADGTFQVDNTEITLRLDKTNKEITLSSTGNWTVNIQGDTSITTTGDTSITTEGDTDITSSGETTIEGSMVKLGENASEAVIKGNTFKTYFDAHIHGTALGPSSPPTVPMPPNTLSTKVETE